MVLDQAACPRRIEQHSKGQVGRRFGGGNGIEGEPGMRREGLLGARIAGRDGWQNLKDRFRQRQRLRLERLQDLVKRLALLRRIKDRRIGRGRRRAGYSDSRGRQSP